MRIRGLFVVESITQITAPIANLYPGTMISDIGSRFGGKYVSPNIGFFTYTRFNNASDENGNIMGLGTMMFNLKVRHRCIKIAVTYDVLSTGTVFTTTELTGLITSALIDGRQYAGIINFETVEGGKAYIVKARLRRLR